jgi:hypothetical protein
LFFESFVVGEDAVGERDFVFMEEDGDETVFF